MLAIGSQAAKGSVSIGLGIRKEMALPGEVYRDGPPAGLVADGVYSDCPPAGLVANGVYTDRPPAGLVADGVYTDEPPAGLVADGVSVFISKLLGILQ